MPKRRDLFEGLSKEDPNYEVGKHFYLKAWADSNGLVADVLSGQASFADFVEGCVKTFDQAARAHVAFEDATSTFQRCRELDGMAKKFIRQFSDSLSSKSKRLGKANTTTAIEQLSRRVNGIAARSKQRILEAALVRGADVRQRVPATDINFCDEGLTSADPLRDVTPLLRPIAGPAKPADRSTRAIVMHPFGSDRVADIKVPRMTYQFPPNFSPSARARLQAERLRGEQALAEKRTSIRGFVEAEVLLLELILRVFVAFAKEGCKLGIQGGVTVEDLESECLRFLRMYALEAGLMDNHFGLPARADAEIPDDLRRRIEGSDEWKTYRRLLIELAEAQATRNSAPERRSSRAPDLKSSRERLDLAAKLARELAAIKPDVKGYCTVETLKQKHPGFTLWGHIEDTELKELVDGTAFTPKAYAETLTLRHYGLTSRETLKKDRKKLKQAKKVDQT